MKQLICYIGVVIFTLVSCKKDRDTTYIQEELPNGYTFELPSNYTKYGENNIKAAWSSKNDSFLFIESINGKTYDLKSEIETFSENQNPNNIYESINKVNTETFKNGDIEGIIFYFENKVRGKRLGLISLTSYVVFAVVQDKNRRFHLKSSTISIDNFNDITRTIKSISSSSSIGYASSQQINSNSETVESLKKEIKIREKRILDSIKRVNDKYEKTIDSLKSIQSFAAHNTKTEVESKMKTEEEEVLLFLDEHYKFYERDKVYRNPFVKKIDDFNFNISIEEVNRRFQDSDFHYRARIVHIARQKDGSLKIGKRYYKTNDGRTRYGDKYY